MDCETFDILGRWEIDRGPQNLHYDFWWNLPRDYMVTSEWGLPPQFENGIVPEDLLSNKYGHHIHFWDLRARRNVQTIDLGANHQMALEVRPAHDPAREYGFLGVVVDTTNLEGSIWTWWREGGKFHIEKTATIPAEPAPKDQLPPLLQGFGAVPPLVTDIDLSMDDKFLYVACWGTGEMRQYDVTDPRKPKLSGSVHTGGITRRTPHPNGKLMPAARRWSRSAATASASTGPTRSIPPGTINSIPTASQAPRSWRTPTQRRPRTGQGLLGRASPTDTARIKSGSRAATARRIRSAIRRRERERRGLDTCRPLAGDHRERHLPWREPRHGMAARRLGRPDGKNPRALMAALWPLSIGHLLAMLLVILPFSLLITLVYWQRQIQVGASLLVIGFGIFRLVHRRHPRALARIRPTQLGLWSFAVAIAHGAGLMLVPIYLGLCRTTDLDQGHRPRQPSSAPTSAWRSWSPSSTPPQ